MIEVNKRSYIYHLISWGLPLTSCILLSVYEKIGTGTAPLCGIPDATWFLATFNLPTAIFIFPAFFLNIYTLIHVIRVGIFVCFI
jgi:hypothetical protein